MRKSPPKVRKPISIFKGKTEEGLQIIVDAQFKNCAIVHRIRTGVDELVDASVSDYGMYSSGTRWYVFTSPWHYSANRRFGDSGNTPVLAANRKKWPGATLEVPREGPARLTYTSKDEVIHLIERL